ncbi:MAG: hypothetical protein JST16_17925 [Bdellovibrionales bacterium]|nr:hypothetical protein [Bdellovibrionales bacterium]
MLRLASRLRLQLRPLLLLALAIIATGAQAKPFRRVLVLTGGSLEFATRLGVWSGLQEAGWVPDLVITTCGSSLMGTFIQSERNPQAVREALFSEEFYTALRASTQMEDSSGLAAIWRIYFQDNDQHFPHIFGRTIVDVPVEAPMRLVDKRFDSHHPRVIMLAAKLAYGPEAQGKAWSELTQPSIQEVFLTDHDTATRIPRLTSPLAAWSPRIAPTTEAISGWNVWEASRTAFADPYLLRPVQIDGAYYATGGIDLVPVEIAKALGDDVLITYTAPMGGAPTRAFKNLFGFDQIKRGRQARAAVGENLRWIDLSDDADVYKKYGISTKLDGFWSFIPLPGLFLELKDRMPRTYEEFLDKTQHQYDYGAERAREALTLAPGGDHSQLRKPWK